MRLLVTGGADEFVILSAPPAGAVAGTGPTRLKPEKGDLVDRVLQRLASLEARLLGGRDFQRLASLRVAACTSRTVGDREGTETYQNHGVTGLQGTSDGFDDCVQRTAGSSFWNISICSDSVNQFRLVHSKSPYFSIEFVSKYVMKSL